MLVCKLLTLPGILAGLHTAYTYWQGYILHIHIGRVMCCIHLHIGFSWRCTDWQGYMLFVAYISSGLHMVICCAYILAMVTCSVHWVTCFVYVTHYSGILCVHFGMIMHVLFTCWQWLHAVCTGLHVLYTGVFTCCFVYLLAGVHAVCTGLHVLYTGVFTCCFVYLLAGVHADVQGFGWWRQRRPGSLVSVQGYGPLQHDQWWHC